MKYGFIVLGVSVALFSPVPHAGILIGGLASFGVSGSLEETEAGTSTDFDFKLSNFGLTAGLALLF